MPKSISVGEKTIGVAARVMAGILMVCELAFEACAVMVPGPEPERTMLQTEPGPSCAGQLWVRVKPVAVSVRLCAASEPRLRRVGFGLWSVESTSAAPTLRESFVRYAPEPVQRLPQLVPAGRTASRTAEGSAVVGAENSGRSKVFVASRLWLVVGWAAPANAGLPEASMAMAWMLTGTEVESAGPAPPTRRLWSMLDCALMRRAAEVPISEMAGMGSSGAVSGSAAQAVLLGPAEIVDCMPGASSVEARTCAPSSERRTAD